ncbi:MAG: UDP-3-O-(3-hydroxymyristoyl)glucosamine N-acyltransferase, partial [Pseudolabrys sp.]
DFVVLGGRVGVNSDVTIGEGAHIAATSMVEDDVPAGARWGGAPAKPTVVPRDDDDQTNGMPEKRHRSGSGRVR